jgi:peptide/nickel transport system permease protein
MMSYIIRRLLYTIPLVIGVSLIVWAVFDSGVLGDPAAKMLGKAATPEKIAQLHEQLGYDQPAYARFWDFLIKNVTFDFGRSRNYKIDIVEMIVRGMGPSLSLTLPAFLLATFIAVSLSLFCASFRGKFIDRFLLVTAIAMMSISSLVYVVIGQYVLAYKAGMFPIAGYERGAGAIVYVALPILIFIALTVGPDLRFYRTAMLEEVKQDYVRTAKAKGVSANKVLFKHVLRNAMIPVLTRVVVVLPFLFTGALLLRPA